MGNIHMGPPCDLVLALRDAFRVAIFFETGTYEGHTARWAAGRFANVITVEASASLHAAAMARGGHFANVEFVCGDSRVAIARRIGDLPQPAIFWLDAHWSGGVTHGADDECPLLGELHEICNAGREDILLIDDARLFVAPPPPPHAADQWPTLDEILQMLSKGPRLRITAIIDDVIVAAPPPALAVLEHYAAHQAKSFSWLPGPAAIVGATC